MGTNVNLYGKMFKVMGAVDNIVKDIDISYGGGKGYKAISEDIVTRTIRKEFLENKLMVFPVEQEIEKINGLTQTNTKYKIIDVETGESELLVSSGQGADTQDKGAGKSMTYSYKYMLLRTFMIPTGEDPDRISSAELDDKAIKTKLPVKPVVNPVVKTTVRVSSIDPDLSLKNILIKKHNGNVADAEKEYKQIVADRNNVEELDAETDKYFKEKFELEGVK